MIYLDNAATTKMDQRVLDAMMPWMTENFGNASSSYKLGKIAREAIDTARKEIADVVGCFPNQIIFTSGGTESDNIAMLNLRCWYNNVLTSNIEHKAVLSGRVRTCSTRHNGVIDVEDFNSKFYSVQAVSVMAVNNETGVLQPYDLIAERCHERGIEYHVDAVQAFGHRPISINHANYMSVSGHKINGPKGIGFLYTNVDKSRMFPWTHGGGQEFGVRSGTEAVPLIVGLAEAVKLHSNPKPVNLGWFEDRLISECGAVINGVSCHDDPWKNIINFQLDVHNDTMIQCLSKKEIYLSAGSACNTSSSKPSHVLKAMGLTDEECNRSLRISVGDGISAEDADTVIQEINRIRKEQKFVDNLDEM